MTHEHMQQLLRERCAAIGAPATMVPEVGRRTDGDGAFVEIEGNRLVYAHMERGVEDKRRTARDVDELLYWCLEAVSGELASRFAAKEALPGVFRQYMLSRQRDLLHTLRPDWGARFMSELAPILIQRPLPAGQVVMEPGSLGALGHPVRGAV